MGLERDILKTLQKRSHTFDELHAAFPQARLSKMLIDLEAKKQVENKNRKKLRMDISFLRRHKRPMLA